MYEFERITDLKERVQAARDSGPSDIVTKLARMLVKRTTSLLTVLGPIATVTTAVGGCLIVVSIGILALPILYVWSPFHVLLTGTSWLWWQAWYLRPILLFPGVILALIADLYVMLMPDFERGAKMTKLAICEEWPLSWYLLHPPKQSVV